MFLAALYRCPSACHCCWIHGRIQGAGTLHASTEGITKAHGSLDRFQLVRSFIIRVRPSADALLMRHRTQTLLILSNVLWVH